MEQLVILLIIGLISFINWFIQKSAEYKKEQERLKQQSERAEGMSATEADIPQEEPSLDERLQTLMEALGQPAPAPSYHSAPALSLAPPPLPTSIETRQTLTEMRKMRELAETFEKTENLHQENTTGTKHYLDLLKNPKNVRDAIVLREILGSPKGLEY